VSQRAGRTGAADVHFRIVDFFQSAHRCDSLVASVSAF